MCKASSSKLTETPILQESKATESELAQRTELVKFMIGLSCQGAKEEEGAKCNKKNIFHAKDSFFSWGIGN
jgi:hypothetical protein